MLYLIACYTFVFMCVYIYSYLSTPQTNPRSYGSKLGPRTAWPKYPKIEERLWPTGVKCWPISGLSYIYMYNYMYMHNFMYIYIYIYMFPIFYYYVPVFPYIIFPVPLLKFSFLGWLMAGILHSAVRPESSRSARGWVCEFLHGFLAGSEKLEG